MVLRFHLNTICTCFLKRFVQRYTEFENYLDICAHAPDCIVGHYDIQGDSQCFSELSSYTGNMQLPYNSPGGYLVHVLFSQCVYFPINSPGRPSANPVNM